MSIKTELKELKEQRQIVLASLACNVAAMSQIETAINFDKEELEELEAQIEELEGTLV